MKGMLKKVAYALKLLGFNPKTFVLFFRGIPFFVRDYQTLKKQLKGQSEFRFGKFHPIMDERFSESGTMKGHYFHQDLLIARRIFENSPVRHIDIGSRIDGFVAHVAAFRQIEVFDIRPQNSRVKNIVFKQADLMNLPQELVNTCESISSLHAIEHFGLGRYSDPIDANGYLKAIQNIYSMLKRGGKFYFSVPIGEQRIEFNAHRVFDISYLLKIFEGKFNVEQFSYVDEQGDLHENIAFDRQLVETNYGCHYGCGIFELSKK